MRLKAFLTALFFVAPTEQISKHFLEDLQRLTILNVEYD